MHKVNEMNAMDSYLECIHLRSQGIEKCEVHISKADRKRFKRMIRDSESMSCDNGVPTIVKLK